MDTNNEIMFPKEFTFNKFTRYSVLIIGIGTVILALCWIVFRINADATTLQKILPFVAIFLAYDSIQRNLFTLNKKEQFVEEVMVELYLLMLIKYRVFH